VISACEVSSLSSDCESVAAVRGRLPLPVIFVKDVTAFWVALRTEEKKPPPVPVVAPEADRELVPRGSSIIGVRGGFIDCESLDGFLLAESDRERRWFKMAGGGPSTEPFLGLCVGDFTSRSSLPMTGVGGVAVRAGDLPGIPGSIMIELRLGLFESDPFVNPLVCHVCAAGNDIVDAPGLDGVAGRPSDVPGLVPSWLGLTGLVLGLSGL